MTTENINEEEIIVNEQDLPPEEEKTDAVIDEREGTWKDSDGDEDSEEEPAEETEEKPPVYDIETQGIPDWALPKLDPDLLEFADGSTLSARAMGDSEKENLWIEVLDENIQFTQAAMIFMDPSKTAKIIYHSSSIETPVYEGFIRMAGIEISKNGKIKVRMKKE